MPTLKVNEIVSYSGNTLSLGTSGNTVSIPANVTFNALSGNVYIPNAILTLDSIVTSNTSTYNLTYGGTSYSPASATVCLVSLNGVIQTPVSAFTISGSTISFSSALTSTDTINFITVLAAPYTINTPGAGTVGITQLSATGTPSSSTFHRGDNTWSQVGLTTGVTGTLPIANGGTNLTTYTAGNLLYASNSTTLTTLPIGTSTQVLGVSSGVPAWTSVSSDYVLLASSDASSSASVSFDGYFSSTYRNYKMIFSGLRMSTTNTNLNARLRTSNADITTSIYKNNNLFIQLDNASTNSAGSGYGGWNQSSILVQRGTNNGATYEGAGEATFYYPLSTTGYKQVKIECQYMWQDLTYFFFQQQFVQCDTTSALSGISIYPTSGTITSGNFKLYGIK